MFAPRKARGGQVPSFATRCLLFPSSAIHRGGKTPRPVCRSDAWEVRPRAPRTLLLADAHRHESGEIVRCRCPWPPVDAGSRSGLLALRGGSE